MAGTAACLEPQDKLEFALDLEQASNRPQQTHHLPKSTLNKLDKPFSDEQEPGEKGSLVQEHPANARQPGSFHRVVEAVLDRRLR